MTREWLHRYRSVKKVHLHKLTTLQIDFIRGDQDLWEYAIICVV